MVNFGFILINLKFAFQVHYQFLKESYKQLSTNDFIILALQNTNGNT